MKVVVPITDGQIANHFGLCREYLFCDVAEGVVAGETLLPNPGHGPGGPPPRFIAAQGATHIVAWGMPEHARDIFANLGIVVELGATGDPRGAVSAYLRQELSRTDEGLDGGGCCGRG